MLREILNKSPHHWEDRKKAEKDFYYLQSLKRELIPSVAIELNREILDKSKINKKLFKNKDDIEIVHFIGGG